MYKRWKVLFALALSAALVTGCATTSAGSASGSSASGSPTAASKVTVVGEVYALAWVAGQVGGERVSVSQLVPSGADIHGYELSPVQVSEVDKAGLFVHVAGVASAVDAALEQATPEQSIDLAKILPTRPAVAHAHSEAKESAATHKTEGAEESGHEHEAAGIDTHMWLSPKSLPTVVEAVAASLSALDPDGAATFAANAKTLNTKLSQLDSDYSTGLASCTYKTVIVTHPAFGYVTDAYGLTQIGISGFDEDTEPSPARLTEISKIAKESNAATIFFANTSSPKVAEVLAADLGLRTGVLSTLTAPTDGQDYLALSRANLEALRTGLACQ